MERKLREMKQQLRQQIPPSTLKAVNMDQVEEEEDNKGYDEYRSPQNAQSKNFTFNNKNAKEQQKQPQVLHTFRDSAQIEKDNKEQLLKQQQEEQKQGSNPQN